MVNMLTISKLIFILALFAQHLHNIAIYCSLIAVLLQSYCSLIAAVRVLVPCVSMAPGLTRLNRAICTYVCCCDSPSTATLQYIYSSSFPQTLINYIPFPGRAHLLY